MIFGKMPSSLSRVQLLLLGLWMLHYVSSTEIYSYEDLIQGEWGDYETNQQLIAEANFVSINRTVDFWLFTRDRPDVRRRLVPHQPKTLVSAGFDGSKPTKIIVHGWLMDTEDKDSVCLTLKKEYFAVGDYNVVCVFWTVIAVDMPYFTSQMRCKEIGEYLGELIMTLTEYSSLTNDDVHILGFSLGAHISGFAGKRLNGKVHRITGLDPAKPLFSVRKPAARLAKTDAKFVDIVHTTSLFLGMHDSIGHIDFYPNGGNSMQPNCGYVLGEPCSHLRAYKFYARTLRSKEEFKAVKCDSWRKFTRSKCTNNAYTYMGEYANSSMTGNYYLYVD